MNTNTVDIHYQQAVITVRNGGGTFARDAARFAVLPGRYIVALGKPYERITDGIATHIAEALRDLSNQRDVWTPERALGTWIDDGKVYVDIVESFHNLRNALRIAKIRGQLAIFDTVTGESIDA